MADEIVPSGPVRLWLPGLGVTDSSIRRVAKAVQDYDESLRLAQHTAYGDWVVVIGEQGHPVFGFGKTLPNPDDVPRILGEHDIKRNGKRIMAELAVEAEKARLDAKYRSSANDDLIAEQFEHAFRKEGRHPRPQVFIPRGVK